MALNLERLQRVIDAGLDNLYSQHQDLWRVKAEQAFSYARVFVQAANQPVRQDDVVPVLEPAFDVCQELREYLAGEKLRQNYWYRYFAEYVVDRLWTHLTGGNYAGAAHPQP